MPRSAIMITRSLKLSLKLVYQLTHKTMICRSKCRPLNRSSIGTNRCISSSSPHPRVCTRADWSAALEIAQALNEKDWEARANGELGLIAFLQGDHGAAVLKITGALAHATKSGDVAAQIRYLTLIGIGLSELGRSEQALGYFDRALKLGASTPGFEHPLL